MASPSHYRDLLQQECMVIGGLCSKWQSILQNNDETSAAVIPDEVCGKIQIAVGQAQLLMRKKFEQFRGLIVDCESGESEKLVTVQDLQGFWELMYIQVSDIRSKFEEVENLKESNWETACHQEIKRQPLVSLNKAANSVARQKSRVVKKDFSAQAKERLAQAKALARQRTTE